MAAADRTSAGALAFSRFVAIGDSFTIGVPAYNGAPTWADHVAATLRQENAELEYVNLAVQGAGTARIIGRQLDRAIAFKPDLVSILCGANDVLLSRRFDPHRFELKFRLIVDRFTCELPNAKIIACGCGPFDSYLPVDDSRRAAIHAGISELNEVLERVASEFQAVYVDRYDEHMQMGPAGWIDDGLHPSPLAQQRFAHAVIDELRAHVGSRNAA